MDWTLPLHCTGVFGRSGSGKTTFAIRHMCNVKGVAVRFIFDYKGEFASRLGITPAGTANELEAALATRWVVFNPHRMFPGRVEDAFRFFCAWAFEVSKRGRGRKILYVDEAWKYTSPNAIPIELAECVQTGRGYGLETFFMSQRPNRMNEAIMNELTEFVCFSLNGENGVEKAIAAGVPADVPASLDKGEFFALNCDSGGVLRGRLF